MSSKRFCTTAVWTWLLASALLLVIPAIALGDCGCGSGCICGVNCTCDQWVNPPAQDPRAHTVRKNQSTLKRHERRAFVEAVLTLKQTFHKDSSISIYDEYVMAHMMAMDTLEVHNRTVFFPWHRVLVRNFELELQAINPKVTIPYWDFTVDNQPDSSLWSSDFMGGDGDPDFDYAVTDGPFRQGNWVLLFDGPDLRRRLGVFASTLPTPDEVLGGLLVSNYDSPSWDTGSDITESFRNYMAGWNWPTGEPEMHNRVHNWVGGSMLAMTSPNDPVFWLVHSNLDRLWAAWEDLHGYDYPEDGPPPGQRRYDIMPPFGVAPADVLDHHSLGYSYDTE